MTGRRADFCWPAQPSAAHELATFSTDKAVYNNIPLERVVGRDEIENTIATLVRPGPLGIESIDFRVINLTARGPVVMTERADVFTLPDRSFELPVTELSKSVAARSRPGGTTSIGTSSLLGWDRGR